jgi:hypothetical protein
MDLLDDDGLTNGTLTLSNSRDGTLVVACGAIAREILAINEILSWDNISIKCLPAIYHNHPEKIRNYDFPESHDQFRPRVLSELSESNSKGYFDLS